MDKVEKAVHHIWDQIDEGASTVVTGSVEGSFELSELNDVLLEVRSIPQVVAAQMGRNANELIYFVDLRG